MNEGQRAMHGGRCCVRGLKEAEVFPGGEAAVVIKQSLSMGVGVPSPRGGSTARRTSVRINVILTCPLMSSFPSRERPFAHCKLLV